MGDTAGNAHGTRDAEARLRLAAIVDSADDAIISKDLAGIVTSWNRAAEAMFGYPAEDIVGRPITLIIPAERIGEEAMILAKIRDGERIRHFETERQHRDGRRLPVSLTISPIRDDAGGIVGISKIARDQTREQRRAALFAAILATVPDAVIVIDAHGSIQSANTAAGKMFGYRLDDMHGRNVAMLMPTHYREKHDGYLARYLATGEKHIIGTGRILAGQRSDGSTFPIEVAVNEVDLPGERLFCGAIRDLTARRARERRLAEVQAELVHVSRVNELGHMVSALAHEISQPLTAMANYRGALRQLLAAGNIDKARGMVELIGEQAERARLIITRLRALVRKDKSQRSVESLAVCIEEARALALIGLSDGLKVEIHVADDAAEALIDRIQVQQVLLNLMRNAAEAMVGSPRRMLSVTTAGAGDMVEIRVGDTGPGLDASVRGRLFGSFVTTKPDGLGIGLSVCQSIIEAHGGELSAMDAPGGGTVFRLTLPRGPAPGPADDAVQPPAPGG